MYALHDDALWRSMGPILHYAVGIYVSNRGVRWRDLLGVIEMLLGVDMSP